MSAIRRALRRLATIVRGHRAADDELRAEMEAHLEMEIDENVRRGLTPGEARRRAMLASGGLTTAVERVREQRGVPWLEGLVADARYALRHFRRTPLSTATIVLVLSLGIGTNVVLFTVLSSLATLPAPGIAADESLVRIRGTAAVPGGGAAHPRLMSWPEVQAYAARSERFGAVAAHADETALVSTGAGTDAPITASVVFATANYFRVLGVRPALGAEPAGEADVARLTTSPTAVISHALWTRRFGGASDVIGRVVRVNDVPVQIVGIAPPRFLGTGGGGVLTMWLPLAAYPLVQKRSAAVFSSADSAFLTVAARLRPGVAPRDATPIVAGIAARMSRGAPPLASSDTRREVGGADVVPMLASNARVSERADLVVSAAASAGFALLVLLITCTNVSALMVGLAVARRREIGVRLALGAPRARLLRQLLTESVLLSLAAAGVGLLVTVAGIEVVGSALEDVQLVVDWRVTTTTCAVAIVTGMLFGLSPALHATRISLSETLKSSAVSVAATRSRLQRALVVLQIALTQPLLVGLGVVVMSMTRDLGGGATASASSHVAEIELDTWAGRVTPAERSSRIAAVVERVAAMPGVVVAMPMEMGTEIAPLVVHPSDRVAGIAYAPSMPARLTAAPKGWFRAFDIPIVRGRDFDAGEYAHDVSAVGRAPSHDAVIVGGDLARRLWGGANPLGRRFVLALPNRPAGEAMVVVGVVDEAVAGPSDIDGELRVYVPYAAISTGVIARTASPAVPMLDALRKVVAAEAPQMPIVRAQTVEQREAALRRKVLRASVALGVGGLLALLLSALGLYAVVSFAVEQRTREIGIRTALGARRGQVVRMFFASGLASSALGLALGLPISLFVTRWMAAMLRWPLTSSPMIGAAIAALVLTVAMVAVWVPARRASRIDPMLALRTD